MLGFTVCAGQKIKPRRLHRKFALQDFGKAFLAAESPVHGDKTVLLFVEAFRSGVRQGIAQMVEVVGFDEDHDSVGSIVAVA